MLQGALTRETDQILLYPHLRPRRQPSPFLSSQTLTLPTASQLATTDPFIASACSTVASYSACSWNFATLAAPSIARASSFARENPHHASPIRGSAPQRLSERLPAFKPADRPSAATATPATVASAPRDALLAPLCLRLPPFD